MHGRPRVPLGTSPYLRALVILVGAALIVSGIAPYDRTTGWLEIFPVLIAGPVLVLTARRFPLTRLTYTLLAVHALILMVGGHYTYARVPLGFWVQDLLGLARNDYDRLGHFVQGFVPAILIREILLRTRSEEHTSELQSRLHLVCRLLLEKKKKNPMKIATVIL